MEKNPAATIPGFIISMTEMAKSPLSLSDLDLLKKTAMFTDDDARYLRMAGEILADQIDAILDVWYGFVASQPHLLYYFTGRDDKPDQEYLAAVRKRFGQWILDTCNAPYDQNWLDYQYEIGLRHHRSKKNKTDNVLPGAEIIHLRYIIAFIYPIVATIKQFLEKKASSNQDLGMMHQAWFKSVVMQVALWSQPFMKEGDY